jgi:hypothetical protein
MEQVRFAIGTVRKRTRQQIRNDLRKKRELKRKETLHKEWREEYTYVYRRLCKGRINVRVLYKYPFIPTQRWLILPNIHHTIHNFIYKSGNTIPHILNRIKRKTNCYDDKTFLKSCRAVALRNQRVRNAFGSLARRWIRSKFRPGNDEDLVTGEKPVTPITLTVWSSRRKYVFEPGTIFKDMITRLTMSLCVFFPNPKLPRNPYTNILMTQGQFFNIIKQLRAKGYTHWTLEALYSVDYDIARFEKEMYVKLKNTILKSLFSRHHDAAGIRLVLEFIEEEHMVHKKHYERELYDWAILGVPLHPHISAWRNLCYKYHTIYNMIPAHPDAASIGIASEALCNTVHGLEKCLTKALNNSETSSSVSL